MWVSCSANVLATCCLLLSCNESVFAVIVVAGKDETALCNLLKIANRWFKHYREWLTLFSSRKCLLLWQRQNLFLFRFVILSSCAVMSGPLGSVDSSEIWDGWSEKKHNKVWQETSWWSETSFSGTWPTGHVSHHQPAITVKPCNKTSLIVVCVLCHCFWLMWFGVVFCVTAEYKTLCPGGEGFRPNPITVILEGQTATSFHVFVRGCSCVQTDNTHPPTMPLSVSFSLSGRHQWVPGAAGLVPGRTVHQHLWQLPVWMSKRLRPQHRNQSLWRYQTHTCISMQPHRRTHRWPIPL